MCGPSWDRGNLRSSTSLQAKSTVTQWLLNVIAPVDSSITRPDRWLLDLPSLLWPLAFSHTYCDRWPSLRLQTWSNHLKGLPYIGLQGQDLYVMPYYVVKKLISSYLHSFSQVSHLWVVVFILLFFLVIGLHRKYVVLFPYYTYVQAWHETLHYCLYCITSTQHKWCRSYPMV